MPTRKLQDLPPHGKLLAVDVGKKTLGLALSDTARMIASPHGTLKRTKWAHDKVALSALVAEKTIVAAIVGLPLHTDGSISPMSQAATAFAELLEQEMSIPVLLWDERLTTKAAESALFEARTGRQTRMSKKDAKQHVDAVAATLILQGVLEALRLQQN